MREADTRSTPSIEEVARRAGVSVSSARNYFSRPEVLSAQTHARLKAAVRETGYVPRGSPAGLGRRRLGHIVYDVPRPEVFGCIATFGQLLLNLLWAVRAA